MTNAEPPCTMTEQAVGWALHALEPDEEMDVLLHIPQCETCQAAVRVAEETGAQLGAAVEQVDPPPALRAAIMSAAAATPQVRGGTPRHAADREAPRPIRPADRLERGGRWTPRRLVGAALAIAAVGAIGVLGVRTVVLQQQVDATTQQAAGIAELLTRLDRPGAKHAVLAKVGTTQPVAAVLVADGQSQVLAVGLPANANDQTYVLWGLRPGAAAQPLGAFDVAGAGNGLRTVGSIAGADGFSTYAISLEPGRVAPASPTEVVAQGQVAI